MLHSLVEDSPMRILITGASGLVGTALSTYLHDCGHTPAPLSRARDKHEPWWDISSGDLSWGKNPEYDAVIHLAGENIVSGRWNKRIKERIRMSRVSGTTLLAQSLAEKEHKPEVFISASAVGFYGDRGDEELNEQSEAGSGFLSQVCQEWEQSCAPAVAAGIRTVNIRLGMVLSPNGGALQQMLPPFRLGLGGPLGSGRQFLSWIDIDDLCRAVGHILQESSLSGPVNMVSSEPVRNKEFATTLGRVLKRPAMLPVPAPALRLLLGEMADALLLTSTRAVPHKLLESGFNFIRPDLYGALKYNT
jgi:hypothetical protein